MTRPKQTNPERDRRDPARVRSRPRGPIASLRRRWLPVLGRLATALGILAAVMWGVGRVMGDGAIWSQWLSWIPTQALVPALWAAGLVSLTLEWISKRPSGTRLRPFVWVVAACVTVWMLWTWSPWRALTASGGAAQATPGFEGGPATVAYWNLSWADPPEDAVARLMPADVVIIANPRTGDARRAFFRRVTSGSAGGGGLPYWRRLGQWTVLSRWPIVADGFLPLPEAEGVPAMHELGQMLGVGYLTFDRASADRTLAEAGGEPSAASPPAEPAGASMTSGSTTLGRTEPTPAPDAYSAGKPDRLTVWLADLPSRPTLHRPDVMRAAARAAGGFPPPEVLIGDFNTPRGADSLNLIAGGMTESHAAAGIGPGKTWPRPVPLWAIDLAFVADGWRVLRSEAVETGVGFHRGVRVTIEPG